MRQRIRVLIADDHPKSRKGLRALLATCPAVEVACEAKDGHEAVCMVEACQPDVVLMDIQMPVWDGLEATRYIKARWPEVRVIALTVWAAWEPAAIAAGADAFLIKGSSSQELLAAVQGKTDIQDQEERSEAETVADAPSAKAEKSHPLCIVSGGALAVV